MVSVQDITSDDEIMSDVFDLIDTGALWEVNCMLFGIKCELRSDQ